MAVRYVPDRGDLICLEFSPQKGREQAGGASARGRPVATCSNHRAGLALIQGAVLCDQVKSRDWSARRVESAGKLPKLSVEDVLAKVLTLLR